MSPSVFPASFIFLYLYLLPSSIGCPRPYFLLHLYYNIRLYGYAFMSNHIHLIVSGTSLDISNFMAFTKREISRRIGIKYKISGPKWQKRYTSTALPTPKSREQCLKYIFSQGVKENLVSHPFHWPGLHCAKSMSTGEMEEGSWFNSTGYKTQKRQQKRTKTPKRVHKANYYESLTIKISSLPHWQSLSDVERRARINEHINAVVAQAEQKRLKTKTKTLGVKKVVQASIHQRVAPPNPPWWQGRRRQITAWANPKAMATRAYLDLYYVFQESFRLASTKLKNNLVAEFPADSWIPTRYFSPAPT